MLESAIYIGLSPNEFWELTPREFIFYIKVFNRKYEENQKEQAAWSYSASATTSMMNARLHPFSKDRTIPTIDEVYPTLFSKTQEEANWERSKIAMMEIAMLYNQKNGEKI